ncbi:MAG: molybdopterin-dependent oxidoreductase [Candidatus Eremiobacteraeota bacterium]|nr:molybdopterin-dependent oxidoreductase [Candidatus Eremiobacteraeota bacterium]MBV8204826.1 molybdopterin-dependent oxidoreductase [Candidatus Eremiobacteraeota bacterium]MBV8340525.1 molybdopterin-dependent oxidoreductase [Candidatus Eremiobacteraeota bacterium]
MVSSEGGDVRVSRRPFLGLIAAASLSGCARIATSLTQNQRVHALLETPERLNLAILGAGQPLAREYAEADISPTFRHNGFDPPASEEYQRWLKDDWRGFALRIDGMVDQPASFDMPSLRNKFIRRSQITRHDCVEGWSVIGKWSGVLLADLLAVARLKPLAQFVVFHCMDDDGTGTLYYESLDIRQAVHPQTLLAYDLNDRPVPAQNGAPLRLKVPTQLGYKSAKHVRRIEVVASLGGSFGRGGYWEDQGYEWYAGI